MKSIKNISLAAVVAIAAILLSFTAAQQQQLLKVELTPEQWNVVFSILDQSTAPHKDVVAVKTVLLEQLQSQIKTDSLTQNQ